MAVGGIRHLWRRASASTGGAIWWNVCYQRGLPRLVYLVFQWTIQLNMYSLAFYQLLS